MIHLFDWYTKGFVVKGKTNTWLAFVGIKDSQPMAQMCQMTKGEPDMWYPNLTKPTIEELLNWVQEAGEGVARIFEASLKIVEWNCSKDDPKMNFDWIINLGEGGVGKTNGKP